MSVSGEILALRQPHSIFDAESVTHPSVETYETGVGLSHQEHREVPCTCI